MSRGLTVTLFGLILAAAYALAVCGCERRTTVIAPNVAPRPPRPVIVPAPVVVPARPWWPWLPPPRRYPWYWNHPWHPHWHR